jgi:Na+/H+-dicarboxylate symporter
LTGGVPETAAAPKVAFLGDLFVRAIRMLVAPIVLVTIAAGITSLADPKRLGGLGGRTVGLFALTTAIAVLLSLEIAATLLLFGAQVIAEFERLGDAPP